MLRQLAQFHAKDPNNLFMVRIAQGLVHLGKGTLTLSPYHSDRQLLSPVALAGLLATLVSFLDVKNSKYNAIWTMSSSMNVFCWNCFDFIHYRLNKISLFQLYWANPITYYTLWQLQCNQGC